MVLEVAGGVAALADVDAVVVHAFDALAMQVTATLFGPHLGDDAFLCSEVVPHLHGIEGGFSLGEHRPALYLACRVGQAMCRAGVGLQVKLEVVGFEDDVVVFGFGLTVIEDFLLVHVAVRRIGSRADDLRLDGRLGALWRDAAGMAL